MSDFLCVRRFCFCAGWLVVRSVPARVGFGESDHTLASREHGLKEDVVVTLHLDKPCFG